MTESDGHQPPKFFELTADHLAVLPPSAGGPRRKTPRKKYPYKPWEDPPELLIPNAQMTDELWAAWDWPPDHDRLPSNRRKVALTLWRRDGNICQVCGLTVDIHLRNGHPAMASQDHVSPLRRYAPKYNASHLEVWGNVVLAHLFCNMAHADFPAEYVAIEDYRRMLTTAVSQFELRGHASPPETFMTGRTSRYETAAWKREQITGRPSGTFGQEWDTGAGN
ncbi:hypothetical protein [Arthrobacter oryzae]|uniref:HNH endonuclease n=1 Tax=Arthrobacter oryzae TaxID=409290 RepID=UPI002855C5C7|nr:hypothetical protein [Arthrobacter oryzae]MDR6507734.1 hypothetical protein [Arthrobacter oryzae]